MNKMDLTYTEVVGYIVEMLHRDPSMSARDVIHMFGLMSKGMPPPDPVREYAAALGEKWIKGQGDMYE